MAVENIMCALFLLFMHLNDWEAHADTSPAVVDTKKEDLVA